MQLVDAIRNSAHQLITDRATPPETREGVQVSVPREVSEKARKVASRTSDDIRCCLWLNVDSLAYARLNLLDADVNAMRYNGF